MTAGVESLGWLKDLSVTVGRLPKAITVLFGRLRRTLARSNPGVYVRFLPLLALLMACTGPSDDGDSGEVEPYDGPVVVWDVVLTGDGGEGVEGAEACTRAGCFISDSAGAVSVEIPVGEATLTMEHPDFVPRLVSMTIDDMAPREDSFALLSPELLQGVYGNAGVTVDLSKAHLFGQVIYGEGTTVTLEPSSGDGPFYAGELGIGVDPDLSATGPGFSGFSFFNIEGSGSLDVAFDGVPEGCLGTVYSQMSTPGTGATVEIRPGFLSLTEIRCPDVTP